MKYLYNPNNGAIYPYTEAYARVGTMQVINQETAMRIIAERRKQAEEIKKSRHLLLTKLQKGEVPDAELLQTVTNRALAAETEKKLAEEVVRAQEAQMIEEAKRKAEPKPQKRKARSRKKKKQEDPAPAVEPPVEPAPNFEVTVNSAELPQDPLFSEPPQAPQSLTLDEIPIPGNPTQGDK